MVGFPSGGEALYPMRVSTWEPGSNVTALPVTVGVEGCADPAVCPNDQAIQCRVDTEILRDKWMHCYAYMDNQQNRWEDWCWNANEQQIYIFTGGNEPAGCVGITLDWDEDGC